MHIRATSLALVSVLFTFGLSAQQSQLSFKSTQVADGIFMLEDGIDTRDGKVPAPKDALPVLAAYGTSCT